MTLLQKRKRLIAASGLLIVAAILAGHVWSAGTVAAVLYTTAAVVAGSDIAVRAWNSLRVRHVSIELLVTIAATGGILVGIHEEAAVVTLLFLVGAYLEERTIRRSRRALQNQVKSAPVRARLLEDGQVTDVPASAVDVGATVRVLPGEGIPVDGVVVGGHSTVDEASITGEPLPAEKTKGSGVFAGTINRNAVLDIRASRVGGETMLARVIRRVEEAQEAQVPVQRFIDRFARWYTPSMIGLSVLAFLISGDIVLALTMLVIACPGALVVATPVAIAAGIGWAARQGMLIRGGSMLERIGKVDALVLDKTGTLTEGRPRVSDVIAHGDDQASLLRWAAIAEAGSNHPLAQPIVAEAERGGEAPAPDAADSVAGQGVRATWQGHEIVVGRESFLTDEGIFVPTSARAEADNLQRNGRTAVLVGVDGTYRGLIGISDALCPAAPELVENLPGAGISRVIMATGDDRRVADAVAREAGIAEVYARQMPEDKLRLIRNLQADGHVVAFAGDGINDAPALAASDVGIAMAGGGTDVAIEAADVALMRDDLTLIPRAVLLSRRTMRVIRQNLAIAVGTVGLLLAGVLGGAITMGVAMLVHEASLLLVILNSLRLLREPSRSMVLSEGHACQMHRTNVVRQSTPELEPAL